MLAAFAAAKRPSERKRAPDFSLPDRQERYVHIKDYRGRVVLLNFWATWWVHCGTEIPMFIRLAELSRGEGWEVIRVAMDEGWWTAVNPYVERINVTYPILLGNKRVGYLYGDIDLLPVTFLLDRTRVYSLNWSLAK